MLLLPCTVSREVDIELFFARVIAEWENKKHDENINGQKLVSCGIKLDDTHYKLNCSIRLAATTMSLNLKKLQYQITRCEFDKKKIRN